MTTIDEAKMLALQLGKTYKPEKIILFGSVATGKNHKDSDIDLLIIKASNKKKPIASRKCSNRSEILPGPHH